VRFQVLTAASMKLSFWIFRRVVLDKFTDVSAVLAAFIIKAIIARRQLSSLIILYEFLWYFVFVQLQ
jgi:hypothetical protein